MSVICYGSAAKRRDWLAEYGDDIPRSGIISSSRRWRDPKSGDDAYVPPAAGSPLRFDCATASLRQEAGQCLQLIFAWTFRDDA